MQYRYFIYFFMLISSAAVAQQLKGKVIDASGNAVAQATVRVNDQATTSTAEDGSFAIDCQTNVIITISHVGFATQSKTISDCASEVVFQLVASASTLQEVEITATSQANKTLLLQPASISKLGEVEIRRGTGLFLDDAINANVPGVFMQRRTVSAGQQFNIRGYGAGGPGVRGANNNFDDQGIKAYLNGIPITDAEGITLLDDIDFGSIGNVEVVKGPSGTLYGLAIAGVVNLQTQKATPNKTSLSENFMIGSYGLRRSTTTAMIGGATSSVMINYGSQNYDGFMQHTRSRKDFVNLVGDFQLGEKQALTAYLGWSDSYEQRNGELSIAQYAVKDYSGNAAYIKNDAHSNIVSLRAGLGYTYRFTNTIANTTSIFGTGMTNNASSAGGWTDKLPFNFGLRSVFDTKFKLSDDIQLTGLTGVEAQRQYAQTIAYGMVTNNANPTGYNIIGAIRSNQATVTSTYSLFTQWTLSLPRDIQITAGLGSSSMDILLNDRLYVAANNVATPTVPTTYATNYPNLYSPSLSINKLLTRNVSVYASYSKGYKAPVSSNIYTPLANSVNTSLRPEIGEQYEFGTKGALLDGKLSYELAYFMATFDNKLTTVAVPNATNTATAYTITVNSGKLDNKGFEAAVKYAIVESEEGFLKLVRPFVNFTYSDFVYRNFYYQGSTGSNPVGTPTDYSGKAVAGVPKYVFNAGVDLVTKVGAYFNATYLHRDSMPITSDNTLSTSNYDLVNAKLGYRTVLAKQFNLDVYAGANNIGGKQYYQMVFINQQPDTYLPGPAEINYFGGVSLKYNFNTK